MPAIVVFETADVKGLAQLLIETYGYKTAMPGYSPAEGNVGTVHWPMESDLPANVLYHPDQNATESYRQVEAYARFNEHELEQAVAFNIEPHWHGLQSRFDDDKPGVRWEDFPER